MNIIILNSSNEPIYEQIKNQIKNEIIRGSLKENELLPSIRQLAKELRISVITTTRAYNELEKEGFITSVQGKGFYVLPTDSNLIKEQVLRSIEDCFMEAIKYSKSINLNKKDMLVIFDNIYGEDHE